MLNLKRIIDSAVIIIWTYGYMDEVAITLSMKDFPFGSMHALIIVIIIVNLKRGHNMCSVIIVLIKVVCQQHIIIIMIFGPN